MEKTTEQLENELQSLTTEEELTSWLKECTHDTVGTYLNELFEKYHTNPSKLATESPISKAYLYKCKDNHSKPSKEMLVKIGFALGATKDEMNQLLKYANHKELYPKNKWDAIILFGLDKKKDVYEIDELLKKRGFTKGLLSEEE